MLPWLPATRKKRFPVAKRSPAKYTPEEIFRSAAGTDDKVARDLKGIFGEDSQDDDKKKKKRSSDGEIATLLELDKKDEHKMQKKSPEPAKEEHEHRSQHQSPKEKDEDDDDEEEGMQIQSNIFRLFEIPTFCH
jgi:hypothetical protein